MFSPIVLDKRRVIKRLKTLRKADFFWKPSFYCAQLKTGTSKLDLCLGNLFSKAAKHSKNRYCDVTLFLAKMAVLVAIENRSIKEGLMLLFLLFPFCLKGKFTGFLDNKSSLITRLSLKQIKSILQTKRLVLYTYKSAIG